MNAADELRAAAVKLRDLATRTSTTLERHELQWTDLTAWAGPGRVSPMVWSQYAAAVNPVVGLALAKLLDDVAELHEPQTCDKHEGCDPLGCQWCGDEDTPCADVRNALAVARALTP